MMRKPEQVERLGSDTRSIPRRHGTVERSREQRPDQISDLCIEQPRELSIIEMTGGHQPNALRFLLVRHVRYLQEVLDHTADQFDERPGRWLLPEQVPVSYTHLT